MRRIGDFGRFLIFLLLRFECTGRDSHSPRQDKDYDAELYRQVDYALVFIVLARAAFHSQWRC